MANGFSGDYAVTLPEVFPSIGEQIRYNQQRQDGLDKEQRDADREENRYRQQKQQQNNLYNLRRINEETDIDKFKVGERVVDNVAISELGKIQSEAIAQHANDDPAALEYWINDRMKNVTGWHSAAANEYKKAQGALAEFNKTYPNSNMSDAYDILMNKFSEDVMKPTSNGSFTMKSPMEMRGTDYKAILESPDILGQITNDESGFGDYIQGIKLEPIGGKEVQDKKGNVHSYKWTGQLSPFAEAVTDEQNRPTDKKIKSETVDVGNGNKIDVLPQSEFDIAMGKPTARASFYSMWNKEKMNRVQNFIRQNKMPITERVENLLKRQFAKEQIEKFDISNVKPEEIEKTPKPPSFNINVGQQQRNQANELIDGITSAIRTGDENSLKQLTSFFKRGNTPFKLEEAFFLPGSNKQKVAIQYYIIDDKGKKKLKEKYFRSDDPYLRDKIIAEYQQDMGSTVPVETLPYEQYLPNIPPTQSDPNKPSNQRKKVEY